MRIFSRSNRIRKTQRKAVYLIPEDLWYIIPAHVFRGQASVALYPGKQSSKYGKYLGAWELLEEAAVTHGLRRVKHRRCVPQSGQRTLYFERKGWDGPHAAVWAQATVH